MRMGGGPERGRVRMGIYLLLAMNYSKLGGEGALYAG